MNVVFEHGFARSATDDVVVETAATDFLVGREELLGH
jgi:hypothetical protein